MFGNKPSFAYPNYNLRERIVFITKDEAIKIIVEENVRLRKDLKQSKDETKFLLNRIAEFEAKLPFRKRWWKK